MASVFLFRHQHAGFVTSHAFTEPLTDEQMEAMKAASDATHGSGWGLCVEIPLVDGEDVPELPTSTCETSEKDTGKGLVELMVGSGVGKVA